MCFYQININQSIYKYLSYIFSAAHFSHPPILTLIHPSCLTVLYIWGRNELGGNGIVFFFFFFFFFFCCFCFIFFLPKLALPGVMLKYERSQYERYVYRWKAKRLELKIWQERLGLKIETKRQGGEMLLPMLSLNVSLYFRPRLNCMIG